MAVTLDVPQVDETDFGEHEAVMERYRDEGTRRALAMDNRGPVRLGADGKLEPQIVDSYRRHGFYVFTGVVSETEAR